MSYRKRTKSQTSATRKPTPAHSAPTYRETNSQVASNNRINFNLTICLGTIMALAGLYLFASPKTVTAIAKLVESIPQTETATSAPKTALPPLENNQQSSPLPSAKSQTELYQNSRLAVVMIYAGNAQGSGVISDGSGTIITNEHVVRGQTTVQVKTTWGKTYEGKVNGVNAKADLAVVSIAATKDRVLPCLGFAAAGAEIGQPVYALSNPLGMESTFTNGMVSRIESNGDILHTATIAPGSSGSPLINAQGKVIAINKAVRRDLVVSIATPAAAITNLAPQLNCTP